MILFKLGGSLLNSGYMKLWINFITYHFKGRAIIVPGGGLFANHIRSVQKNYNLKDDIFVLLGNGPSLADVIYQK